MTKRHCQILFYLGFLFAGAGAWMPTRITYDGLFADLWVWKMGIFSFGMALVLITTLIYLIRNGFEPTRLEKDTSK